MKSLGPKPTVKQMETLRKLCEPGVTVHWWSGIRGPDGADICWPSSQQIGKRERLRVDTLSKFHDWGWIEAIGDPAWAWRNMEYRVTETGRKVVELGIVRK